MGANRPWAPIGHGRQSPMGAKAGGNNSVVMRTSYSLPSSLPNPCAAFRPFTIRWIAKAEGVRYRAAHASCLLSDFSRGCLHLVACR